MAIAEAAQRFQALKKETNVSITDFLNIKNSDLYNAPTNALKEVTGELQSLVDSAKSSIGSLLPDISGLEDNLTRATKGIFGSLKDLSGFTPQALESEFASMLPDNPTIQGMFRKLASSCRTGAMGNRAGGKGFKDSTNCGGGTGKCDTGSTSGLLNKLTGGILGTASKLLNQALSALMTLSNLGYDIGLCKVFQEVANSLGANNNIMGKAAGALIGSLSSKGNVAGVIDVAGSSSGLATLLRNPGAVAQSVTGFNVASTVASGVSSLTDRFTGAMEILDTNWNKSETDGILSVAKMGEPTNASWISSLTSKAKETTANLSNLGGVIQNNTAAMASSYSSALNSLSSSKFSLFA